MIALVEQEVKDFYDVLYINNKTKEYLEHSHQNHVHYFITNGVVLNRVLYFDYRNEKNDFHRFVEEMKLKLSVCTWWVFESQCEDAYVEDLRLEGFVENDFMIIETLEMSEFEEVQCCQDVLFVIVDEDDDVLMREFMNIVFYANYNGRGDLYLSENVEMYVDLMKEIRGESWINVLGYVQNDMGRIYVSTATLFTGYDTNVSFIHHIATMPNQQRKGYGAATFNEILQIAKRLNVQTVALQADPPGLRLYEKFHFRRHSVVKCFEWSKQ